MINNKKYNEAAFPKEIRRYIPLNYNASTKIKAVDTRASKSCSGLFLEVLGLYCNNKNYDPAEAKCAYSKSSQILKLSEEEIDSNCEKVCIAMDRAFAFLQIRCGVQSLSDVNYKLMIRLIAYIFTNDKWYGSEKVHDIIEAWYWAAIFSGEYDKDQNERFEKNLRSILETLTTKAKKYDWIITLKNNIFETPYFSDCSFLLMEKANEDRIPKEHLAKYICQFYLSRTYSDLIHDDRQINVFSKYKLEKHHIVPVGSVSKIGESTDILRKDKTNIVNSLLEYPRHREPDEKEDNIRIYVPMDLNKDAILRRLDNIIGLYGEAREDNEIEFSIDVGMIISQLEIYDQIWFVRHMPKKGEHSREAKELVTEIIARLEDIPDGCAECFPFELIDELKQEYLTDNSL